MINVALIGCGYWGTKLRRYIVENEDLNLVCTCNSDTSLGAVWRDDNIDAVVIATPNATHYDLAKKALESGKHVLVEKPLAFHVDQCAELAGIAEERGLVLETEYTYTYSNKLRQIAILLNKVDNVGIEMSVKHLGRFGGGSVYWLLGSHMLSVLDMFTPIEELRFYRNDIYAYDGVVETGDIYFGGDRINGRISLSLNYPYKQTQITFYCDEFTITYDPAEEYPIRKKNYRRKPWVVGPKLRGLDVPFAGDEGHNLRLAVENFVDCIGGKTEHNVDRATMVTGVIEEIHP